MVAGAAHVLVQMTNRWKCGEQVALDIEILVDECFAQGAVGWIFQQCVPGSLRLDHKDALGRLVLRGTPGPSVRAANRERRAAIIAEKVSKKMRALRLVRSRKHSSPFCSTESAHRRSGGTQSYEPKSAEFMVYHSM